MKITKETLKQLIKEELSEMMNPQGMSKQQKLEKIVDLIMTDDIRLVDYPGSPDVRQRLKVYGSEVGMELDSIDNLEDFRNSLIMSSGKNFDKVVKFLTLVIGQ